MNRIIIDTPVREVGSQADADGNEWVVFEHTGAVRVTVEIAAKGAER